MNWPQELVGWPSQITSQVQIQGFELAHPNIYSIIDELLECMRASSGDPKLQVLHDRGQYKISERSPSEVPVLIMYRSSSPCTRPENLYNEH